MPKCIKPPGSGAASCISTVCPMRARWYAADRPLGPAPTTRTRFPVGAPSTFNGHFSLTARSPRKRSTAWCLPSHRVRCDCSYLRKGDSRLCHAQPTSGCRVRVFPMPHGICPLGSGRANLGCSLRPGKHCCRAAKDQCRSTLVVYWTGALTVGQVDNRRHIARLGNHCRASVIVRVKWTIARPKVTTR